MEHLNRIFQHIMVYADRLSPQHWVLVLAGMVVVGWFCLRGFGSRSHY
jgi:hypothetical protein